MSEFDSVLNYIANLDVVNENKEEGEATNTKASNKKKKTRVYCCMAGDLSHYGHINFLKNAIAQVSDNRDDVYMMVGLMSDETIKGYKRLPILTCAERANIFRGYKYCDEVIEDAPYNTTKEFMEKHNIEYVCGFLEGGSASGGSAYDESYAHAIKTGRFKIIPRTPGISTTNILNRIKSRIKEGTL